MMMIPDVDNQNVLLNVKREEFIQTDRRTMSV
jgi:hypothetical protein